jgi:hypothetical protein
LDSDPEKENRAMGENAEAPTARGMWGAHGVDADTVNPCQCDQKGPTVPERTSNASWRVACCYCFTTTPPRKTLAGAVDAWNVKNPKSE